MKAYKLLILTSKFDVSGATSLDKLTQQIEFVRKLGIHCEILIDPSRYELEMKILNEHYDCIYPATMRSYRCIDRKPTLHNFNTLLVLEYYKKDFIGSSYLTQLLINDKALTNNKSGIAPPGITITRTMYEYNPNFLKNVICKINKIGFPVIVKPNDMCNSIGLSKNSITHSYQDLKEKISDLFTMFDSLSEVRVEKYLSKAKEFTVALLGQGKTQLNSIIELQYDKTAIGLYGENEKNTPISKRPIKYSVIDNRDLKSLLICTANEIFYAFGMKDIGRFDFLYEEKLYLIDINGFPVLGNSFSWEWQCKYNISTEVLLAVILYKYNETQLKNGSSRQLPNRIAEYINFEIIKQFKNDQIFCKKMEQWRLLN